MNRVIFLGLFAGCTVLAAASHSAMAGSVTFGAPDPSDTISVSQTVTIPIVTDTGLISLVAIVNLNGPATIVSATDQSEAADFGWDTEFSSDPNISPESVEMGLASFNGTTAGVVAEVVIQCTGPGDVTVTLSPSSFLGDSMDVNFAVPVIEDTLVIHQSEDGQIVLDIQKITLKAGKDRSAPQDNIAVLARSAAPLAPFDPADDVVVRVSSGGTDYIQETIAHDNPSLKISAKRNVLTYNGSMGALSNLKISQSNGVFVLAAKKIDLSGLQDEVAVEIQIGDQVLAGTADEAVINGKKPAPILLLAGHTDALRLLKAGVSKNADKLALKGEIALHEMPDPNTAAIDVTAVWGGKTFTFPITRKKPGKNLFVVKKVLLNDNSFLTASFDFDKGSFTIAIANTSSLTNSGTVTFSLQLGIFNQTAAYIFD